MSDSDSISDSDTDSIALQVDQTDSYYPRDLEDAVAVLNILQQWLPSELGLSILTHAGYWLRSRAARKESKRFTEHNCRDRTPYLVSEPIKGERFPVQEIRIDVWSHDQGWSSYPDDHGTYNGSWTWFDLGIQRPSGREDISTGLGRAVTNVHASLTTRHHEVVYRRDEQPWMRELQADDQISIIPRALYPGWQNITEGISIEIYTELL
ncbi:hypothetical protein N7466_007353 [Penicillium verhagenii]|uniref:uncharacterized protein n=1 Tax=Penicillium verhagenii TaxID=1562060 RepID=UPI0025451038|nr:uncharacterized protein N7466_007353 [Penicillium verhagenii]KAJ5928397.1 hypothetical protein N7466_007353 [Penicillium verhagenii]